MRHRPKKENYPAGQFGEIDYQESLERYCTYLENENNKLHAGGVSLQRELLKAYDEKMTNKHMFFMPTPKKSKDEFLEEFNCG